MNSVLIATLAGIVTAACWGVGDWLTAKLSKKLDKFEINFGVNAPAFFIMLPILLASGAPIPDIQLLARLWLAGTLISCGYLSFVTALRSGSVGIVVPLSNIYAILTLALSAVFIGSVFSGGQVIAILVIVAGAALLAYEKNHNKIPFRELHRETFFSVIAAVFWGTGFFVINTLINDLPWYVISGYMTIFMSFNALIILLVAIGFKSSFAVKRPLKNKTVLLAAVVFQIGSITFYVGSIEAGSVIIPAVIAAAAPLISSGLAAVYDKEKVGLVKRFGAVIVVVGIVILNLV